MHEIKTILGHMLMMYDIKLGNGGGGRPPNWWIGFACVPDMKAQLSFRKRQT